MDLEKLPAIEQQCSDMQYRLQIGKVCSDIMERCIVCKRQTRTSFYGLIHLAAFVPGLDKISLHGSHDS